MPVTLASLGLGGATIGLWVTRHRIWFFPLALLLLAVSLLAALREKKKTGKNSGIIIFLLALLITLGLLLYTKITSGYFL